jgi:hypothetical protein
VSTNYVLIIVFSTGTTGLSHLKIKSPTTLGPRDEACERSVLFATSFYIFIAFRNSETAHDGKKKKKHNM